jgi:hypothetical protein
LKPSKRRKGRAQPAHTPAARTLPELAPGSAQELLRRSLLVLVTGLLVARPLVLGEDPGLQSDLSDPGGLVLTLLWLFAAAGWAAWHLWARPAGWRVGVVEAALLGTVALTFGSVELAAHYRHPARLIGWDWFSFLIVLFLVRQLAVNQGERRRLLAVLLAGAVTLSAYAVWQAAVELPAQRQQYASDEALRSSLRGQSSGPLPDDASLAELRRWLNEGRAFSTYAHPNSLAGVLALFLPALAVAVVLLFRQGRGPEVVDSSPLPAALAGIGLLLTVAALAVTRSRGAFLGLGLVVLGAAVLHWRRFLWTHKGLVAAGLAVLAGGGYVGARAGLFTTAFGKGMETAAYRLDYWKATLAMIVAHPWFGVGPGNFGNEYTRFMLPTALETIKDPHNFVLEVWACSGPLAALVLVVAVAAFFVRVARAPAEAPPPVEGDVAAAGAVPGMAPMRVEFYLAGMLGLLLGLLLRGVEPLDPNAPFWERWEPVLVPALLRSVVWFAAFAVFERVAWPERWLGLSLAAGVAALLLNLCVSGGIAYPSVAVLLWATVGLALNSPPPPPLRAAGWQRVAAAAPLPVLAALAGFYLVSLFYPVVSASARVKLAPEEAAYVWKAGDTYDKVSATQYRSNVYASLLREWNRNHPNATENVRQGLPQPGDRVYLPPPKILAQGDPRVNFAVQRVEALRQAAVEDPGDAALHVNLAYRNGELWEFDPKDGEIARRRIERALDIEPMPRAEQLTEEQRAAERAMPLGALILYRLERARYYSYQTGGRAVWHAVVAQHLDPDGRQGYTVEYLLRLQFAKRLEVKQRPPAAGLAFGGFLAAARVIHYRNDPLGKEYLAKAREQCLLAAEALERYLPHDPNNANLRADLAEALDRAGEGGRAREQAQAALECDAQTPGGPRKLSDRQRSQMQALLGEGPPP